MVQKNSTNINKMNNIISPQIIEHTKTRKNIMHGFGNPGPGLGQAQKSGRVSLRI